MKMGRIASCFVIGIGVVPACLVLAFATRGHWLPLAGALVQEVRPCPPTVEAVLLLMGDPRLRPRVAADFLRSHPEATLLLARPEDDDAAAFHLVPNEADLTVQLLTAYGMDRGRIQVVDGATRTTKDEAKTLRDAVVQRSPRPSQVALVTSWFHTRRALWIFSRAFAATGIELCTVPATSASDSPERWWQDDRGMVAVFSEWVKSLRYLLVYGILGRDRDGETRR